MCMVIRMYVYVFAHSVLCHCCTCMYVCTYMVHVCYMYIYPRVHAGIDEMDIFINIDLNTFLDVRHVHHVHTTSYSLLITLTCMCVCNVGTEFCVIPSFMGACNSTLNFISI